MSGYLIANYTIDNPDVYQRYVKAVTPVIAKYGGKLIVGDFELETLEGKPHQGIVIVEFESAEVAQRFYNSPEYTQNKHPRISSTDGWVTIAKEFTPPKQ